MKLAKEDPVFWSIVQPLVRPAQFEVKLVLWPNRPSGLSEKYTCRLRRIRLPPALNV